MREHCGLACYGIAGQGGFCFNHGSNKTPPAKAQDAVARGGKALIERVS
jgi:hypothetical protein